MDAHQQKQTLEVIQPSLWGRLQYRVYNNIQKQVWVKELNLYKQ